MLAHPSGLALVAVLDVLREAERPMPVRRISKLSKVDPDKVRETIAQLESEQMLTVYCIGEGRHYELKSLWVKEASHV